MTLTKQQFVDVLCEATLIYKSENELYSAYVNEYPLNSVIETAYVLLDDKLKENKDKQDTRNKQDKYKLDNMVYSYTEREYGLVIRFYPSKLQRKDIFKAECKAFLDALNSSQEYEPTIACDGTTFGEINITPVNSDSWDYWIGETWAFDIERFKKHVTNIINKQLEAKTQ